MNPDSLPCRQLTRPAQCGRVRPLLSFPSAWLLASIFLLFVLEVFAWANQPRLRVEAVNGRQIRLAWPTNAIGYVLESSPVVGTGAAWARVSDAPVLVGAEFVVTLATAPTVQFYRLRLVQAGPLTRISSTSPAQGEGGVAVTRETVLRLTAPLAPTAVVGPDRLYAEFGGRRVLSRVQLGSDRRSLTLFYLEPIPSSARIRVTLKGDGLKDESDRDLDVDGDGKPGGTFRLEFETLSLAVVSQTSVSGRVFASQLRPSVAGGNTFINVPLGGVTITVDGMEQELRAVTDSFGNFRLEPVPAGEFFVHIDGRTVTNLVEGIRYPDRAYYPNVGKKWASVAGQETKLGEIYLPLIPADTLQPVSLDRDTTLAFKPEFVAANPQFEGVSITVPAGALFSDNGLRGGMVGIAPVPPDRLPGPLPDGLPIQDVITIQTDGGSNFDRPVPACFPNLPDPRTGEKLPPGAKSALWSFNHDTGRFEIVGSATVSADGRLVCTDPGVGITAPGWHGTAPGSTARGGRIYCGGAPEDEQEPPTECGPDPAPNPTDPVYLFSGEFQETVVDLEIAGRGMDFTWARKYRSKIGRNTAQGNGWDYSYNIYVEQEGDDLLLHDGNTRVDRYVRQPDGSYLASGFFRKLETRADGVLAMVFPDRAEWSFTPLNGGPARGKIASITDRHGNRIRFAYDAAGRLSRVTDTLDRAVDVLYNDQGRISGLRDFIGRTLRYEYFGAGSSLGNDGDLKSVTSPAVVGTPNGNDFPSGKTISYTYSTGAADDRLNHNLLTITDGRRNDASDATFGGGPYLVNVYSSTTDPEDPLFDRVIRQVWGGQPIDLTYVPMAPSLLNGEAVLKCIVRDRVGHVKESIFDIKNRLTRYREFTGKSDVNSPVTEGENRPLNPLRAEDPEFFETVFEYNADSLQSRVIHPNGNITQYIYESDLNPGASPITRGNLRAVRSLPGTHQPAGEQSVIETAFEYESGFGSACCGTSFVSREIDPLGRVTRYQYDTQGNVTRVTYPVEGIVDDFEYNAAGQITAHIWPPDSQGVRQRDVFEYGTEGPDRGYLVRQVVDADGLKLTTRYSRDGVGNIISMTDGRGNTTEYVVNAMNQVVRQYSPEPRPGAGFRHQTDFHFDANNNLRQVDVLNLDEKGVPEADALVTTRFEHEILNRVTRRLAEVEQDRFVITEYEYDANRNMILMRSPEAVSGRDPGNTVRTVFDERDLPFEELRAPASAAPGRIRFRYDGNRNLVATLYGADGARATLATFDGFNRKVSQSDPLGNLSLATYDAAGRLIRTTLRGQPSDGPGGAANVRMKESRYEYDAVDRLVRVEDAFFNVSTQQPIGPGARTQTWTYNNRSQVVSMADANGNTTTYRYDSSGRLLSVADPAGNSRSNTYDPGSNLIAVDELERSPVTAITQRHTQVYDALNRLVQTTDSLGQSVSYSYNSRNQTVLSVDGLGNAVRLTTDGLGRLTSVARRLTDSGNGSGVTVGEVVTRMGWDDNSRLVFREDAMGNRTQYRYDSLDRQVGVVFADGTAESVEYDAFDHPVRVTDAAGTVVVARRDALGRTLERAITPGPGVAATTTFERFSYDSLGQIVTAENDGSKVIREFDSLSNLVRETVNGASVLSSYDAEGNPVTTRYPGGRLVQRDYDTLNRARRVQDAQGTLAEYEFAGTDRVVRIQRRNKTQTRFDYDGVGRPTRVLHARDIPGDPALDDRSYAWNTANRKTSVRSLHDESRVDYAYDSLHRLTRSSRSTQTGGPSSIDYLYDFAGNRTEVRGNSPGAGVYRSTGVSDVAMHQYSATPSEERRHDAKGNVVAEQAAGGAARTLSYDYQNRMVAVSSAGGRPVASYAYDAFGRRISKTLGSGEGSTSSTFVYDGWRVLEELDAQGRTTASYTYGHALDEPLQVLRADGEFFFHQDQNQNVVVLTAANGEPVERYDYDDFGTPSFYSATRVSLEPAAARNHLLFTGQRYDPETGLYFYRTRYFEPVSGRFLSRDALGIWGDPVNLGNPNSYVGNDPISMVDPFGLETESPPIRTAAQAADALDRHRNRLEDYISESLVPKGSLGTGLAIALNTGLEIAGVFTDALRLGQGTGNIISRSYDTPGADVMTWANARDALADVGRAATVIPAARGVARAGANLAGKAASAGARTASTLATVARGGTAATAEGALAGRVGANSANIMAQLRANPPPVASLADPRLQAVINHLRRGGTAEGHATAAAIQSGKVQVSFVKTLGGPGGVNPHDMANRAIIALDSVKSTSQAAGMVAHETCHVFQRVVPFYQPGVAPLMSKATYQNPLARLLLERRAYEWQRAVDPTFKMSNMGIWKHVIEGYIW